MYTSPIFRKVRNTHVRIKLTSIIVSVVGLATAAVMPLTASALGGGGYTLFGDASLVSPGNNSQTAAQIESSATVSPNYGGVDFGVPSGVTDVNSLNTLSADYMFTHGSCGGGAPRFVVTVTTPSNGSQEIWSYIGPSPNYTGCPDNVWQNTGNLLSSPNTVDASQVPGGHQYESWADVQAAFGSYPVTDINVVVDGYWLGSTQTVQVDNVQLNGNTVTFEPALTANSCKNGGWQKITSAPGPFKNQGDCVSYFATGGKNVASN